MKLKNKKAILMPETLKIIIAVVCIFLLVYLAVLLYGLLIKKTALEQAGENLKQIVAEINGLEDGEKGDFLVTAPKGWGLVGTDYHYQDKLPDKCLNRNCLCICPEINDLGTKKYDCRKQGVCEVLDNKIILDIIQYFGREGFVSGEQFGERINPGEKHEYYDISVDSVVPFDKLPLMLYFKKEKEDVVISDIEIDTEITVNFLNKEIEFEQGKITIKELIERLFNKCSEEDVSSWSGWNPKIDKNVKNFVEQESKSYINDLIKQNKANGGKIVFTTATTTHFENILLVSEGNTDSCEVVEEKKICHNEISQNRADPLRVLRAYLRIYTC